MEIARSKLYECLHSKVGNTPLIELRNIQLANNCRLFAKVEFFNPTGNHHDRQYINLFRDAEEGGLISPNNQVIEVTSGCAGISFAWFAKHLNYKAIVIVPQELPGNRIMKIAEQGCEVIINPNGYIPGCVKKLRRILANDRSIYCMNHSRMKSSYISLMDIATEALNERPSLDVYIAMMGSGSSVLGPGMIFNSKGKEVIAWEPAQSGYAYSMQKKDYEDRFGFAPGTYNHNVWGGSFNGLTFPHVTEAIKILTDNIILIGSDDFMKVDLKGNNIPNWQTMKTNWPLGNSSLGNIVAAIEYSRRHANKEILTVLYDSSIYY